MPHHTLQIIRRHFVLLGIDETKIPTKREVDGVNLVDCTKKQVTLTLTKIQHDGGRRLCIAHQNKHTHAGARACTRAHTTHRTPHIHTPGPQMHLRGARASFLLAWDPLSHEGADWMEQGHLQYGEVLLSAARVPRRSLGFGFPRKKRRRTILPSFGFPRMRFAACAVGGHVRATCFGSQLRSSRSSRSSRVSDSSKRIHALGTTAYSYTSRSVLHIMRAFFEFKIAWRCTLTRISAAACAFLRFHARRNCFHTTSKVRFAAPQSARATRLTKSEIVIMSLPRATSLSRPQCPRLAASRGMSAAHRSWATRCSAPATPGYTSLRR